MRALLVTSVVVAAAVRAASATPYETFIDIDDQADLEDLLASGDITQDTFDELLELLHSGVDLSTADRAQLYALPNLTYDDVDQILAFREQNKGVIRDPAALAAAGALSDDKLLAISAFLVITPASERLAVKGWARAMTRWSPGDRGAPPLALRGRFSLRNHVRAGFAAVVTRLQVGDPVYDPNRDALIAEAPRNRFDLPKLFVAYEDDQLAAIAGSFRAGFGQRLVFDNSSRYTPNGLYADDELFFSSDLVSACREAAGELAVSPCAGAAGGRYVTPDWRWRDGLFGVGAGVKRLAVGPGWLQGYVWASASQRSIYQYELIDRTDCADPHDDRNSGCGAPTVFVDPDGGSSLAPTSRFTFVTLPDVFQERLAGLNVSYFADRRTSIGLTAYGADEANLVSGLELDTQEWSRLPTGGRFGAAGANVAIGRRAIDVFGEAAVSFDRMPNEPDATGSRGPEAGGGGAAAIVRVTHTRKRAELETVLRYYSIDFANPYARPISQSDEFDGQRARDELGARVRYYHGDRRYAVRALLDLWVPPSSLRSDSVLGRAQPKLDSYLRGELRAAQAWRLGLWLRYQDKDLRAGGHMQCFSVSTEFSEDGEPIPCGGRQLTTIAHARWQPNRKLSYEVMLEHQLLDDPSASETAFRHDLAGWLIGHFRPNPGLRMRGRLRFQDEAISDNSYLERSLSALIDGALTVRRRDIVRLRIDGKWWLDDRTSTAERDPNPELQLWLSYEARL